MPRLVRVGPLHVCGAGPARAAGAGLVEFGVEGFDAGGDSLEDGGDVRVLQVEVQGGGFTDEGELFGRHGQGRGGRAAEELGFEAVEVCFEVDEFGGVAAAGELGQELVDGAAAGRFDVAARTEGRGGPLLALAEEDPFDKIVADVAIIEVSAQVRVIIGQPAEEDADELELVDVFGRVTGAVGGRGALGQGPVVSFAEGELELVAVVGAVRVAVAGAAVRFVGWRREKHIAYFDISGCSPCV